jgi:hypothetical protein
MGTSGTGHDLCPSLVSRAHQASGPSCGGNWKIIKTAFGFKGVAKNIDPVLEAAECCRPCRCSAVAVASCRSPTRPSLAPGAEHLPVSFSQRTSSAWDCFRRQCARRLGLRPSCMRTALRGGRVHACQTVASQQAHGRRHLDPHPGRRLARLTHRWVRHPPLGKGTLFLSEGWNVDFHLLEE